MWGLPLFIAVLLGVSFSVEAHVTQTTQRKLLTISYWKYPFTAPGPLCDSYQFSTEFSVEGELYESEYQTELKPGRYEAIFTSSRVYSGLGSATFSVSGFDAADDPATWTVQYPATSRIGSVMYLCDDGYTTVSTGLKANCNGFGWYSGSKKIYYYQEFTFELYNTTDVTFKVDTTWNGSKRAGFEPMYIFIYCLP